MGEQVVGGTAVAVRVGIVFVARLLEKSVDALAEAGFTCSHGVARWYGVSGSVDLPFNVDDLERKFGIKIKIEEIFPL